MRQARDADGLAAELDTPEKRQRYVAEMYGPRFWAAPGSFSSDDVAFHVEPFGDADSFRASIANYEYAGGPRQVSEAPRIFEKSAVPTLLLVRAGGPRDPARFPAADGGRVHRAGRSVRRGGRRALPPVGAGGGAESGDSVFLPGPPVSIVGAMSAEPGEEPPVRPVSRAAEFAAEQVESIVATAQESAEKLVEAARTEAESARQEAESVRALARESAQADVEAARKEASARIRDAQVAADEVLEQAKAVSGGMKQLAHLLTTHAERILRDVTNSHRAMSADLRAAARNEPLVNGDDGRAPDEAAEPRRRRDAPAPPRAPAATTRSPTSSRRAGSRTSAAFRPARMRTYVRGVAERQGNRCGARDRKLAARSSGFPSTGR